MNKCAVQGLFVRWMGRFLRFIGAAAMHDRAAEAKTKAGLT
jgi:hypothetical protein